MRDSFDKPEPPPEPKPQLPPIAPWARKMEKLLVGKWWVFDHPQAGKVAGLCTSAKFSGYSEPGKIPDFLLSLRGRSGREAEVSLVDSKAMSFDTMEEALEEI